METLMHLLVEALKANIAGRNQLGVMDDPMPPEMSGFILENVQVATMPYIEEAVEEEEEPPNPLLRLVNDRDQLRKERVWLGASTTDENYDFSDDTDVTDDPDSADDTCGNISASNKGSRSTKPKSIRTSAGSNTVPARVATRPIVLEKEQRSCLARLLFSRCWMGKDDTAGWKIKRRCPKKGEDGGRVSLSCPCRDIGPCRKVKKCPVPIDQMKSTGPGSKKNTKATASSGGSKFSRKTNESKNQKRNAISKPRASKPVGKPLYEKLFPCCFKDHMHSECCCRCKDNPRLTGPKKTREESRKSGSPKAADRGKRSSPYSGKSSGNVEHASEDYEYSEDEFGTPEADFETFNVRDVSNPDEIYHLSPQKATSEKKSAIKKKTSESASHPQEKHDEFPDHHKSTTSFEIVLHPDISDDESVKPDVVSHQILKTLSTIHGPVKVEQKIVVQGTENSVVIVTHGEACQCNLCNMLKGKMHPKELVEGLSPQVVKVSTDNGYNTLVNHSDGCKCELCLVLDPALTKNAENGSGELRNENVVIAAHSASNENDPVGKQARHSDDTHAVPAKSIVEHRNKKSSMIRSTLLFNKSRSKNLNGKKISKKCRCTKCRQRRRVEKLKLRLKRELGSEEYDRIIHDVTENDNRDSSRRTSLHHVSDDEYFVKRQRNRKSVSFSDDPKYRGETENPDRKGGCKLCEIMKLNANQGLGLFTSNTESWHIQNHNEPVYSMAGLQEIPCKCHATFGSHRKRNKDQLRTNSSSSEDMVYRSKSEEQKCFPPDHIPGDSHVEQAAEKKKMKREVREEIRRFEDRNGSSCSGRCRREVLKEEAFGHGSEHSAILLQEGSFPKKFVYWAPTSRSNVATAYSSESYYVPDPDEFPIVNVECDESVSRSGRTASSGGAPVHRLQIPVWFRMCPDHSTR